MIVRYALFEGSVKINEVPAFRRFVKENLVPLWKQFDGAEGVRVSFGETRDDGAPEFPLILAISYADLDAMQCALACPAREESRIVTAEMLEKYFEGRIHHHVTSTEDYPV